MKTLKQYLKNISHVVISASIIASGSAVTCLVFDLIDLHHKNKSNGLELLSDGAHLKKGLHRVVITDQFYDMLTYQTSKEDQDLAINSIKKAYYTLNEYNNGIKFSLYTTVDGLDEYNIEKIDEIKNEDISLYLSENELNENHAIAITKSHIDSFTREISELSITFKKDVTFNVFEIYDSPEKTFDPLNSVFYATTLHESMHAMGFAHQDTKDTIMYPYISYDTPRDLTEKDKKMIDKYNVAFYGTEPRFEENSTKSKKSAVKMDDNFSL